MKTISEYTDLEIPTWALPYLVNGDDSGLTEEDKAEADQFMASFDKEAKEKGGYVIFSPGDNDGSFTHSPEFGLACDCVESTILIAVAD